MNSVFDYLDAFILGNTFTLPQLRHEIMQAESKATVAEYYRGTPYEDDDCRFLWASYSECCREAVKAIQDHNKRHPQLVAPGKRLDIAGIKSRNDIVTVIEGYAQLHKSGHNRFTGRCPLHEDRHPSLTVYGDNQSWHCFQCNKGGDVFDFIMAVNSCDFKQAAAALGGV